MSTPNEVYNSNSVEHGGLFVNIYRGQTTPVLLGTYTVESANPVPETLETNRPAIDGGDNGFVFVDGKKEGSVVVQRAASAPTILTGDFFKTSFITYDAAGAGVTEIYVFKSPSEDTDIGYRKQSATIRQDKFPTAAVLGVSEYTPAQTTPP